MPDQTLFEAFCPPDQDDPYFRVHVYQKIGEEIGPAGNPVPRVQWRRTDYLGPHDPRIQAWVEWHCKGGEQESPAIDHD